MSICTLTDLNPGFGGPWDMLGIFFVNVIFIMLQKNSFGKKIFEKKILNSMHGFKSAILPELKNCQNGTFEPVDEIKKIFWPKHFFSSIVKMTFTY